MLKKKERGPESVKTSIRLPRELWKRAHIRAMDEDKDLQDVIAEALAAFLKGGSR